MLEKEVTFPLSSLLSSEKDISFLFMKIKPWNLPYLSIMIFQEAFQDWSIVLNCGDKKIYDVAYGSFAFLKIQASNLPNLCIMIF